MIIRLSSREYARHRKSRGLRGATQRTVIDAIRDGRLTHHSVFRNSKGHWSINPELADKEWADNTVSPNSLQPQYSEIPSRAKCQARKEAAQAELAELELEHKKGSLVAMAEVEAMWFTLGRQIRNAMESIPARALERVCARLGVADQQSMMTARMILEEEIDSALKNLSQSMRDVVSNA